MQPTKKFCGNDELPRDVKESVNACVDSAIKNFNDLGPEGMLMPVTIMIEQDGEHHVIGMEMPQESERRDRIGEMLRDMARKTSPVAIMFISETWMVNTAGFAKALGCDLDKVMADKNKDDFVVVSEAMMAVRAMHNQLYGSIKNMPGAFEAVFISVETIWGDFTKILLITRDASGKGSLVIPEGTGWQSEEKTESAGRFAHLLEKTPSI